MALDFFRKYFWWSPFGIIELEIILIIFGLLFLAVWWVFRRRKSFRQAWPNPGSEPETALDILKKRYVKGEITKEEFERMKKDILD